jgi:hypothetical protein
LKNQKLALYKKKHNRFIHFACLRTVKGTILALASNDPKKHAEVNVIEKAKKKYTIRELRDFCKREGGFILEVVRYDFVNDGEFKNSHPCDNCKKRIEKCCGIIKVFHS